MKSRAKPKPSLRDEIKEDLESFQPFDLDSIPQAQGQFTDDGFAKPKPRKDKSE